MLKILRESLEKTVKFVEGSKRLKPILPVFEAMNYFFFSGGEVCSSAPFIRDHCDLKRFMSIVVIAVAPASLLSIYFFGWRAMAIILVSYIFGGAAESIFAVVRKEEINEGFLVTGLLFPLILPPTIPLWMVAVGIVFGVVFGKEVFGGTGRNVFNPAIVGRIFLAITFPVHMVSNWTEPLTGFPAGFSRWVSDAVSQATPLAIIKETGSFPLEQLFWGNVSGSIGETSAIAILLGGVYLVFTKVANWRIPVAYIGSVMLFSLVGHTFAPDTFPGIPLTVLSGGLLFGAIFMATDPVSAPYTNEARWIYGILIGVFTMIIRYMSGYVEGVMFAILLMNTFAPILDDVVVRIRFKGARA